MPRPKTCIAPGCRKPNKGPRFHYLCEEHREAGKKQQKEWQEAHRAKVKKGKR